MKYLTREQIREIDRRAIEDYGMPGVILMENAGRNAAQVIVERSGLGPGALVAVFCGRGNNGGDGFVIARHLFNRGFAVEIVLAGHAQALAPDAAVNYGIARKMELAIHPFERTQASTLVGRCGIVVDALLGTGFSGEVRAPIDDVIRVINSATHAVKVAVDVPSGLDCNTGQAAATTVHADLTVTFVAAKTGFAAAAAYTGEVVVVDIGAPRTLLDV